MRPALSMSRHDQREAVTLHFDIVTEPLAEIAAAETGTGVNPTFERGDIETEKDPLLSSKRTHRCEYPLRPSHPSQALSCRSINQNSRATAFAASVLPTIEVEELDIFLQNTCPASSQHPKSHSEGAHDHSTEKYILLLQRFSHFVVEELPGGDRILWPTRCTSKRT